MTEQRPPVDFDAQKAADRVAELIAEGSILARGWAERFARRREDDQPAAPAASPDPAPSPPGTAAVEAAPEPLPGGDPWSDACDQPTVAGSTAADDVGSPAAHTDDPGAAVADGDLADDVQALMGALRATVARRLDVPASRVHITVALDDAAGAAGSGTGVVVPTSLTSAERDPIDALTATLDDLAARARKRLTEELGVRLPDIIAEIRFPAGGRPSVRIRPSARAGTGAPGGGGGLGGAGGPGGAGTPDLEAVLRRLLLGRDAH